MRGSGLTGPGAASGESAARSGGRLSGGAESGLEESMEKTRMLATVRLVNKDFEEAEQLFRRALGQPGGGTDPENWLGLMMSVRNIAGKEALASYDTPIDDDEYYQKALACASEEGSRELQKIAANCRENRDWAKKTEKERAQCEAKVRSLMASYAIEDEEGDDDSICMGDLWGPVGRMPYSVQVISRIVQLHTGVFVVKEHLGGGTRLRAYGRRDEVEVALYLMDVLHNALEKELARRRALTPDLYYGVGGTNSFYAGVLAAMKERMEKHDGDRSEEKALTLAQADNEERARRIVFQDCRITRRSGKGRLNRAAYAGGQDYGSSLTIAKGIGKDSHGPLMLS